LRPPSPPSFSPPPLGAPLPAAAEASCGFPADCPFISPVARCGGGVGCHHNNASVAVPSSCRFRWDAAGFARTFRGHRLWFVGDSVSTQHWRSLLCLEQERLTPDAHRALRHARQVHPERSPDHRHPVCAPLNVGLELCHHAARDLDGVLSSLLKHSMLRRGNVIVLNSHAHEPRRAETEQVQRLASWLDQHPDARLPAIVWRTRAAVHFRDEFVDHNPYETEHCHPIADARRQRLVLWDANGTGHRLLRERGARVLDGGVDTVDSSHAHPFVGCGREKQPYYDCTHYCQPGPLMRWNERLVELFR